MTRVPSFATTTSRPRPIERSGGQPQNVLSSGASFRGTLQVEDDVRIDGTFQGDVVTRGTLEVSSGAKFSGSIDASFARIAGSFEGDIRCSEQTELLPGSKVKGEIVTRRLSVQDGAVFDGNIKMAEQSS
jgi:cytoskeletal protein CcmA (bactofilin family)